MMYSVLQKSVEWETGVEGKRTKEFYFWRFLTKLEKLAVISGNAQSTPFTFYHTHQTCLASNQVVDRFKLMWVVKRATSLSTRFAAMLPIKILQVLT